MTSLGDIARNAGRALVNAPIVGAAARMFRREMTSQSVQRDPNLDTEIMEHPNTPLFDRSVSFSGGQPIEDGRAIAAGHLLGIIEEKYEQGGAAATQLCCESFVARNSHGDQPNNELVEIYGKLLVVSLSDQLFTDAQKILVEELNKCPFLQSIPLEG